MKVLMISGLYPLPDMPQYGIFIKELKDAMNEKVDIEMVVPLTVAELKKHGIRPCGERIDNINYIPYFRLPKYFNLFAAASFLKRRIIKEYGTKLNDFDIIHGHGTLPEGMTAVQLAKAFHKKAIVHVHGHDVYFDMSIGPKLLKIPNRYACKWVYKNADLIAGVSKYVNDRIKVRVSNVKCIVAYNGVNREKFSPIVECRKGKCTKPFQIITVGNLIPVKGIDTIIKAVKRVVDRGYDVQLLIFGRGSLMRDLENLVESLTLKDYVQFMGYQDVSVVSEYMRRADLFVLTAYYEAFGCVYTEAMASGIPVIGSEKVGISEIIIDGENGMLVQPGDFEAMSDKMIRLITDSELSDKLVKNGLITAEKYSWCRTADLIIDTYRRLLNE